MSEIEATYSVYWPRGQRAFDVEPVAPKVNSLSGKVVAFLWDYLFRGDEIFAILKKEMETRFPGVTFVGPDEFGCTHGADEREIVAAIPGKLKTLRVDAAISGMGC